VNRTFFQVLTPEFGKSARDRVEGFVLRERSHLVPEQGSRGQFSEHTFFPQYSHQDSGTVPMLGKKWYFGALSTECLNATLFCTSAHQCTISQAPDVNKI